MPHWTCDRCGARLYSASESLKWRGCPVCSGNLAREPRGRRPESRFGRPGPVSAEQARRKPG
jgi:predicted  nucleic acid-binding Zn-ribbon protein